MQFSATGRSPGWLPHAPGWCSSRAVPSRRPRGRPLGQLSAHPTPPALSPLLAPLAAARPSLLPTLSLGTQCVSLSLLGCGIPNAHGQAGGTSTPPSTLCGARHVGAARESPVGSKGRKRTAQRLPWGTRTHRDACSANASACPHPRGHFNVDPCRLVPRDTHMRTGGRVHIRRMDDGEQAVPEGRMAMPTLSGPFPPRSQKCARTEWSPSPHPAG